MTAGMELSERKHTILKAIIQNYLETGEPVGSRTLSKSTDLNLSSATIRNVMADLEDLGYIEKYDAGEDGQSRQSPEAGGKSTGSQYELCDDGFCSDQPEEYIEVYPAVSGK